MLGLLLSQILTLPLSFKHKEAQEVLVECIVLKSGVFMSSLHQEFNGNALK